MPSGIASAVCLKIVVGRTRGVQEGSHIHIGRISPQRFAVAEALANLSDREGNHYDDNRDVKIGEHGSVAAATAAAATAASARESAGWFGRSAIARPIRRAEHRKLNRILLPRALRAGNLLRLVQHNLLKVRLAVLTNVFVNRHLQTSIDSCKRLYQSHQSFYSPKTMAPCKTWSH